VRRTLCIRVYYASFARVCRLGSALQRQRCNVQSRLGGTCQGIAILKYPFPSPLSYAFLPLVRLRVGDPLAPPLSLSAAESEVIALSAATQEAVYLRKLANELGFTQTSPTTLYEDCTAAVALSKENRFRNRSKHIALRWSFDSERQHPSVGDIQVISVSRKIMLADIFASPRPAASFIPFRDSLLGRTSRITPLALRDASPPDDDASSDE
jgi:hypothetical protein